MERLTKQEDNAYKFGAGRFILEAGALQHIAAEIARHGKKPYILAGPTAWEKAGDAILTSLSAQHMPYLLQVYPGNCSHESAMTFAQEKDMATCDLILGVGGGRMMDFAKLTAEYAQKPCIAVPTQSATCACFTPLSVCYTPEGQTVGTIKYNREVAAVIADMNLLATQPVRLLTAGAYDAMAKVIEITQRVKGKQPHELSIGMRAAFDFAVFAGNVLEKELPTAVAALSRDPQHPALYDVIWLSLAGAGMISGMAKGSNQCAIAHKFYETTRIILNRECASLLHGELVAMGLIAQSYYNRDPAKAISIKATMASLGLATTLTEAGVVPTQALFDDYMTRIIHSSAMVGTTEQDHTRLFDALQTIIC